MTGLFYYTRCKWLKQIIQYIVSTFPSPFNVGFPKIENVLYKTNNTDGGGGGLT